MLDIELIKNQFAQPMVSTTLDLPEVPKGGAVVQVSYAGACYSEGSLRKKGIRPSLPGYEISGYVHEVSEELPNQNLTVGDKVIIFPEEDLCDSGYAEYIPVEDPINIIQVPDCIPMEVAAMLPGGALTAYSAVQKAKPHVEKLLKVKPTVNVLIVGAGGLGLWTVKVAQALISLNGNKVRVTVADNSIDKLLTAQDHGCWDIIHWNEEDHEQYIIERTLDTCRGGVDVVIDFVSSPRTMKRALKVLNREGLVLVGGNTMSEVSINLNALAAKQQSIVGVPKGTVEQLRELVDAVSENKISPPCYSVFPVEDANQVFEDLSQCRITGRAILHFASSTTNSNASSTTNSNQ